MAKLNSFSFMVAAAFLFSAIVLISHTSAFTEETLEAGISPGVDVAFAPEYNYDESDDLANPPDPADRREFLRECTEKVTRDCGEDLFLYMFEDVTVHKICCSELVSLGEACHIAMVKNIFSMPMYKANAASGILRSKQLWDKCAVILGDASSFSSSSPIPVDY